MFCCIIITGVGSMETPCALKFISSSCVTVGSHVVVIAILVSPIRPLAGFIVAASQRKRTPKTGAKEFSPGASELSKGESQSSRHTKSSSGASFLCGRKDQEPQQLWSSAAITRSCSGCRYKRSRCDRWWALVDSWPSLAKAIEETTKEIKTVFESGNSLNWTTGSLQVAGTSPADVWNLLHGCRLSWLLYSRVSVFPLACYDVLLQRQSSGMPWILFWNFLVYLMAM